jgi:hypothetical protein
LASQEELFFRKHTASQLQISVDLCLEGTGEHGNEPSGFIKGREFLDYLSDYQLLKKDSIIDFSKTPQYQTQHIQNSYSNCGSETR